jgi:Ca-activated chloride channel family protein
MPGGNSRPERHRASRVHKLSLTFTALGAIVLLGAAPGPAVAQETRPSCLDDAMLVFDASGSMAATDFPDGAPSRLDRVRQALVRVLPAATRMRRLGLMVYGPGPNYDTCRNVTLRLPPSPNAGDRIMAMVDDLRPQGRTALTTSVRQAVEFLRHGEKPAVVVALTDGQDTCGGDACGLALELKARYPDVTVHVIGYRLSPMRGPRPPFVERCLADETGGIFATAETTEELTNALSETLGCPAVTLLAPGTTAR